MSDTFTPAEAAGWEAQALRRYRAKRNAELLGKGKSIEEAQMCHAMERQIAAATQELTETEHRLIRSGLPAAAVREALRRKARKAEMEMGE